jgi:hypothetical protein
MALSSRPEDIDHASTRIDSCATIPGPQKAPPTGWQPGWGRTNVVTVLVVETGDWSLQGGVVPTSKSLRTESMWMRGIGHPKY